MAWTTSDIPDQSGKITVVTGANSGLGFEASKELARTGATVLMAVRDMEKGRHALDTIKAEVPSARLELHTLDLGSLESVHAFTRTVLAEHGVVDILLNNAGLMATPAGKTRDGFETQVGINHLGHFVLTGGLMSMLEKASVGRVVTMTSVARMQGRTLTEAAIELRGHYGPWQAYADSKLANYQFGVELARRLEAADSSVSSLVAHPGLSNTNLQVATVTGAGAGMQAKLWRFFARTVGMSQSQGVLSALRAATDPNAKNGEAYGPRWNLRGAPVRIGLEAKRLAEADTEQMWRVSETETNTTFAVESPA